MGVDAVCIMRSALHLQIKSGALTALKSFIDIFKHFSLGGRAEDTALLTLARPTAPIGEWKHARDYNRRTPDDLLWSKPPAPDNFAGRCIRNSDCGLRSESIKPGCFVGGRGCLF